MIITKRAFERRRDLVTQHRTFGECAYDISMQERFERSLEALLGNEPLYKRVGRASRPLLILQEASFPQELADDVAVLFSVFDHVKHYDDGYIDYSPIPLHLSRAWVKAFLRVYRLLKMAKGAASVLDHPSEAARIDKACRLLASAT
jgi:hypothetical protein